MLASLNRLGYRCTYPMRPCGNMYTNNHTLKPCSHNICRRTPVVIHNQLKILWRFLCMVRRATKTQSPLTLCNVTFVSCLSYNFFLQYIVGNLTFTLRSISLPLLCPCLWPVRRVKKSSFSHAMTSFCLSLTRSGLNEVFGRPWEFHIRK